MINQEKRSGL